LHLCCLRCFYDLSSAACGAFHISPEVVNRSFLYKSWESAVSTSMVFGMLFSEIYSNLGFSKFGPAEKARFNTLRIQFLHDRLELVLMQLCIPLWKQYNNLNMSILTWIAQINDDSGICNNIVQVQYLVESICERHFFRTGGDVAGVRVLFRSWNKIIESIFASGDPLNAYLRLKTDYDIKWNTIQSAMQRQC